MAIFDETTPESEAKFEDLVGEGKKFKDPDALAHAKQEADRVIKDREREAAELREALAEAETRARLALEAAAQRTPQSERPASEVSPPAAAPVLTDEDLAARIRAVTENDSVERQKARNAQEVVDKLIEVYGSEEKANQVVNQKAKELNVPVSFLFDSAKQSPASFYAQVGLDVKAQPTPSAPHSNLSAVALGDTRTGAKPGTYAYYENIRKTEGNQVYFSPKIQNQLMKDAREKGDAFYS